MRSSEYDSLVSLLHTSQGKNGIVAQRERKLVFAEGDVMILTASVGS